MRGQTVLILLMVVVGLVAFIELYEHDLPSSEERAALEKLVLDVEIGEITAVDLAWGQERVRLEREPIGDAELENDDDATSFSWRLTRPFAARADADLVASLLESLATLEKKRTLNGSSSDEVGLNPPRLEATVSAGSREWKLQVGSEVPTGDSMIVSAGDSGEFVVVDSAPWSELSRKPGDWRSREVLGFDEARVARVALTRTDEDLVLVRRGADFWLEHPFVDLADEERVRGLLATLVSMRVDSFADELPEPISGSAFDPPGGELEVTEVGSGDVLRLEWDGEIQEMDSRHLARADGQVFSTEADLQEYFDTPPADWRSLRLTSLAPFEIDGLSVMQPGEDDMRLSRDGANWVRDAVEISFTSVSELLRAIADVRAGAVLGQSKGDLLRNAVSEPLLELVLKGEDGEQTLSFFAHENEGTRAVVDNRESVLWVRQDKFSEILAKVAQVRGAGSVKTDADEQPISSDRDLSSDQ